MLCSWCLINFKTKPCMKGDETSLPPPPQCTFPPMSPFIITHCTTEKVLMPFYDVITLRHSLAEHPGVRGVGGISEHGVLFNGDPLWCIWAAPEIPVYNKYMYTVYTTYILLPGIVLLWTPPFLSSYFYYSVTTRFSTSGFFMNQFPPSPWVYH